MEGFGEVKVDHSACNYKDKPRCGPQSHKEHLECPLSSGVEFPAATVCP